MTTSPATPIDSFPCPYDDDTCPGNCIPLDSFEEMLALDPTLLHTTKGH